MGYVRTPRVVFRQHLRLGHTKTVVPGGGEGGEVDEGHALVLRSSGRRYRMQAGLIAYWNAADASGWRNQNSVDFRGLGVGYVFFEVGLDRGVGHPFVVVTELDEHPVARGPLRLDGAPQQ